MPGCARTVAGLRVTRGSTAAGRRARLLALAGFDSTLDGIAAQLAFERNDSGNIEAATRDAKRADRFLRRGADDLRAAGRLLDVEVGTLHGY